MKSFESVLYLSNLFFPHDSSTIERTCRYHLSELRMGPRHFPHGAGMSLPVCSAHPLFILVQVPDFHSVIRGAGGHTPAVEVEGYIVDDVFVFCWNDFCGEHLIMCKWWSIVLQSGTICIPRTFSKRWNFNHNLEILRSHQE